MQNQMKSLYDAALELCSYCKASAETGQTTEHTCVAKPIYSAVDALAKMHDRLEKLEYLDAQNRALGEQLLVVERDRDRYFKQKQENGHIVKNLRDKFQRIRALTPKTKCGGYDYYGDYVGSVQAVLNE